MATITKAEFEALPDSLKPKFKADGDSYQLIEEDVEGLKKNKQDILEEKKKADKELDELRKFKADFEANQQKAKQADLEAQGKYEEALKEKEKAWEDRFKSEQSERNTLLSDIKRERLTNELVKRGALPDRASYLVGELDQVIDLVKGDTGYQLQKKGGIGDATEFDAVIETAKQKTPFFFAGSTQTGGGATGSGTGTGGTQNANLSPVQKLETMFSKS
jgi:chromosome segregation ATPase